MYSEIERLAAERAREAVQLDRQGLRGIAASKYRQAIDLLLRVYNLQQDQGIRSVYMEKVREYQGRVQQLSDEPRRRDSPESTDGEDLILAERPRVSWDDVVGLAEAKEAIRESIVYPYRRPDLFPLGWPNGILLFGPPGCGKTLLAAAVASEIDAAFFCVDAASVMSKWLGESEKNISALFSSAREACKAGRPAVIFVDEMDSLTGVRRLEVGGEVRARNQLLKEMDGLAGKGRLEHLYVLGATNKPWELDEPFIRRFQKRIYVPLPDAEARLSMLKHYTAKLSLDPTVDLEEIARRMETYSGSDIHDVCMEAQIKVVRELFENSGQGSSPRSVSMDDFLCVMRGRGSSVSPENMERLMNWSKIHGAL